MLADVSSYTHRGETSFTGSSDPIEYNKDRQMISSFAQLYQRRTALSQDIEYISWEVRTLVADTEDIISIIRLDQNRDATNPSSYNKSYSDTFVSRFGNDSIGSAHRLDLDSIRNRHETGNYYSFIY